MKVASFITARLKSKRLPKKVLKMLNGKPMIAHLVDRLKLSKECKKIILCTSILDQDNPLEDFAISNGIEVFRGDPDDVLLRLRDAAKKFNTDLISSCTADNPLIDPISMDELIKYHKKNNFDFCKSENLPFGTFTMTVSRKAVEKACEIKNSNNTEFWPQYILKSGIFSTSQLFHKDPRVMRPKLRLTVDEELDFELMNIIFKTLSRNFDKKIFSLHDVVEFLDNNPKISEINSEVIQKIPPPIMLKEKQRIKYEVVNG